MVKAIVRLKAFMSGMASLFQINSSFSLPYKERREEQGFKANRDMKRKGVVRDDQKALDRDLQKVMDDFTFAFERKRLEVMSE